MRLLLLNFCALLLAGCIHVYHPDVQQGNVLTPETIEKLKTGMTTAQVRFLLGTPPVSDSFHPDRWDYVYYLRTDPGAPIETRRLTVVFKGDILNQIEDSGHDPAPGAPASP